MMSDAPNIFRLYMESKQEPQMTTDKFGVKRWMLNGKLHRDDGPAIEYANDGKRWYQHGLKHREDGPAVERYNGDKAWYIRDELHRTDGAAVELANGTKRWYVDGLSYVGVEEWAKAALEYEDWAKAPSEYEYKEPTQQMIDDKVAQVMQQDLFD